VTLVDLKNNRKTFLPSALSIYQMEKFIPNGIKENLINSSNPNKTSQINSILLRQEIWLERHSRSKEL